MVLLHRVLKDTYRVTSKGSVLFYKLLFYYMHVPAGVAVVFLVIIY